MQVSEEELEEQTGHTVIPVSAKEETGIDRAGAGDQVHVHTTARLILTTRCMITNVAAQKSAGRKRWKALRWCRRSVEDGMPEDFYSIDLMNAYEKLGTIIGEAVEDDLVNEIFSKFCMGK